MPAQRRATKKPHPQIRSRAYAEEARNKAFRKELDIIGEFTNDGQYIPQGHSGLIKEVEEVGDAKKQRMSRAFGGL